MSVDIPLLRKAVEWAEAEAAKPDGRGDWYQPITVTPPAERQMYGIEYEGCGTAYCIAGYIAAQVTGLTNPYDSPLIETTLCQFAAEQIGVPRDVAAELWSMSNSIEDVRRIAEDIAGERL